MGDEFFDTAEARMQIAEQWLLGEIMALARYETPTQQQVDAALGLRTANDDYLQPPNSRG